MIVGPIQDSDQGKAGDINCLVHSICCDISAWLGQRREHLARSELFEMSRSVEVAGHFSFGLRKFYSEVVRLV